MKEQEKLEALIIGIWAGMCSIWILGQLCYLLGIFK